MADGRTLSCPIKLPPLTGIPYPSCPSVKLPTPAATAPPVTSQPGKQGSFKDTLTSALRPVQAKPAASETSPEEVGRQLESFLMSLVFKFAFNSQLTEGVFGNSNEYRMFFDMFLDSAVDQSTRTSSLGIAKMVARDINLKEHRMLSEDDQNGSAEL